MLKDLVTKLEHQFEASPKWFLHKTAAVLIPLSGQQIFALLETQHFTLKQVGIVLKTGEPFRLSVNKADFEQHMVEVVPSEMLEILYG